MGVAPRVLAVCVIAAVVAMGFATPARAIMNVPIWTAGDFWTYYVFGLEWASGNARHDVLGTETVTVGGVPYTSYRVHIDSRAVAATPGNPWVNDTGTSWYRLSDLALVKQDVNRTTSSPPSAPAVNTVITFDPPAAIQWPLITGAAWSASGWRDTSTTPAGSPTTWRNVSYTTTFEVGPYQALYPGSYETVSVTASSGGFVNLTYWAPTVGNLVLFEESNPGGGLVRGLSSAYGFRLQARQTDTTPPEVDVDSIYPNPATVGGYVEIRAAVEEDLSVASVSINITLLDATHMNMTMRSLGIYVRNGHQYFIYYMYTFAVRVGIYPFTMWAIDGAGHAASVTGSYEIIPPDIAPPVITNAIANPPTQSSGGAVTISATINDDSALFPRVNVRLPDGTHLNMTMERMGSQYWFTSVWNEVGTYAFTIWAIDPFGHVASATGSFQIGTTADATPPSVAGVSAAPSSQTAGGRVTIFATVTDDTGVANVAVDVTEPNGAHIGGTMTALGTTYFFSAAWSQVGTHVFTVSASDIVGKTSVASGSFTIRAGDDAPPTITHAPPPSLYTDDLIRIDAIIADDASVQDVRLVYTPIGGTEQNVTMPQAGGVYTYAIPGQSTAGTVRYHIYAIDTSGNARVSSEYSVEVRARPTEPPAAASDVGAVVLETALLAGVVAAVVSGFIGMLMTRRRRPESEPPVSPPK